MTETAARDETPMIDSTDPEFRVKALIALTQELTDIFVQENDCLRARNAAGMAPLQEDKARLAAAYATTIRQIADDRDCAAPAGEALLSQLRSITKIFEARAAEQRALLNGAQQAGESVLKAIAAELTAQEQAPGYGETGRGVSSTAAQAPGSDAGRAAHRPLAINENA